MNTGSIATLVAVVIGFFGFFFVRDAYQAYRLRPWRKKMIDAHETFKRDKTPENFARMFNALNTYNRERFR